MISSIKITLIYRLFHIHQPPRSKRYRNTYSEAEISAACDKIRHKEMSIKKAAKHYGIPRTTIRSRLAKKNQTVFRSGPATVLTPEEELELEEWVFDMQKRGFPVTKQMLLGNVKKYLDANPKANKVPENVPGKSSIPSFFVKSITRIFFLKSLVLSRSDLDAAVPETASENFVANPGIRYEGQCHCVSL